MSHQSHQKVNQSQLQSQPGVGAPGIPSRPAATQHHQAFVPQQHQQQPMAAASVAAPAPTQNAQLGALQNTQEDLEKTITKLEKGRIEKKLRSSSFVTSCFCCMCSPCYCEMPYSLGCSTLGNFACLNCSGFNSGCFLLGCGGKYLCFQGDTCYQKVCQYDCVQTCCCFIGGCALPFTSDTIPCNCALLGCHMCGSKK